MIVPVDELRRTVDAALVGFGYDADEVAQISEVLMYAQLRGNNQGVSKLVGAGLGKDPTAGEIEVVRETTISALLDARRSPGMVAATRATGIAIAKCSEHGFGVVGVNNINSSTGAIGFYARSIASAGHVGFVFAGSPEAVAVHGSYRPLLGTNPIAIGVPSAAAPVVLDMATSAMAYFGIVEAQVAGREIPDDVAYDEEGHPTTDPARALGGAIRPFDRSHKGSGLGLIVEILAGPLVGAAYGGIGDTLNNWGFLVMALDPGLLVDPREFAQGVGTLAEKVRAVAPLPDATEVLVPGDRGDRVAAERLGRGAIEVEDNLWRELRAAAGV